MSKVMSIKVVVCPKCGFKPIHVKKHEYWAICPVCSENIAVRSE